MKYRRRIVFASACLSMLVFGMVVATLGSILPEVSERFRIDKAAAGSLFSLLSLGILFGSLLFGPAVDRMGYRWPMVAASLVVMAGLHLIGQSAEFSAVRFGVLLAGLGGGVINGGSNALVADISDQRHKASGLSLVGVFFGVGAVGVPFVFGTLSERITYPTLCLIVSAVALWSIASMLMVRFPPPKQARGFPVAEAFALLREPALLTFGSILFLQSAVEITMGGWSSTFAREELRLDARASLYLLSLYWFGMMLGRLALGWLLTRVRPARAMFSGIGLAFAGVLLLLLGRSTVFAAIGLFLAGAGFSPGFPVILGWVGQRYAALSGTAFSVSLVMAVSGGMIVPLVTGMVARNLGLRSSLMVVPIALLGSSALLTLITARWLPKALTHTG
jgi:fucose permease